MRPPQRTRTYEDRLPAPSPTVVPKPAPRRSLVAAEPTVLVLGAGEQMLEALKGALARHGVYVETATGRDVLEAVVTTAPDLVLLVGDATEASGRAMLEQFASSPKGSGVPVALLGEDADLSARLAAFRHGAVAIIPRTASIDAVAERVAGLARALPEPGQAQGADVGESTLDELVSTLRRELRSGILSVHSGDADGAPVRLVLDRGKPLATLIDDFVQRVRATISRAEPLQWEFDERSGGTLDVLDAVGESRFDGPSIAGVRVILADDDAARADAVAQELRARGASVVVTDLHPSDVHLARLRPHDPAVLVLGTTALYGAGYALVQRMRADTRLRWAALLAVSWEELWADGELAPLTAKLIQKLADLSAPERRLAELLAAGTAFEFALDALGPARLLRQLAGTSRPLRATVVNPRYRLRLHLAEGLLAGAEGEATGAALQGVGAVASLLGLANGQITVEPVEHVGSANIMSPVDVTLAQAEREPVLVAPSVLAPQEPVVEAPAVSVPRAASVPEFSLVPANVSPPSFELSSASFVQPPREAADRPTYRPPPLPAVASRLAVSSAAPAPTQAREPSVAPAPQGGPSPGPAASARPRSLRLWLGVTAAAGLLVASGLAGAFAAFLSDRASEASVEAAAREGARLPLPEATVGAVASVAPAPPAATPPLEGPAAAVEPPAVSAAAASASAVLARGEPLSPGPSCEPGADVVAERGERLRAVAEAQRAVKVGDLEAARRAYCRAVELAPKDVAMLSGLIGTLLLAGDGAEALKWAERAHHQHPTDPTLTGQLADARALTGDLDGARELLLELNGLAPSDYRGIEQAFLTYRTQGQEALSHRGNARAERFFRRAVVLRPEDRLATLGLARSLDAVGAAARARYWNDRARALRRP